MMLLAKRCDRREAQEEAHAADAARHAAGDAGDDDGHDGWHDGRAAAARQGGAPAAAGAGA